MTRLSLQYLETGRFVLDEPLVYRGSREAIVVPAEFRTDLASVPRAVRWLLPQDGPWAASAVLHDWLCVQLADWWRDHHEDEQPVVPSGDADGLFRRTMREAGVPLLRRWLMWTGVRWGALANPARRRGWWRDAPAVLALSLLAAPLVVPASLVVLAALALYALAEAVVSLFDPDTGGSPS